MGEGVIVLLLMMIVNSGFVSRVRVEKGAEVRKRGMRGEG